MLLGTDYHVVILKKYVTIAPILLPVWFDFLLVQLQQSEQLLWKVQHISPISTLMFEIVFENNPYFVALSVAIAWLGIVSSISINWHIYGGERGGSALKSGALLVL